MPYDPLSGLGNRASLRQQARANAVAAANTPPSTLAQAWVRVSPSDSLADLRTALNEVIADAIGKGTYVADFLCEDGEYIFDLPTLKGGAGMGNAQLIPPAIVPESGQQVVLRMLGAGSAGPMHWAQTMSRKVGTVFRSTLTGQTSDGTYGAPSVIGTPAVQVGNNPLAPDFSNIHIVIDGITVMKPQDPSLVSVDLRGAGQASVINLASMVDAPASALIGNPGDNGLGVGLMMPAPGNNAVARIGTYVSEGDNCALTISEHVEAGYVLALYNDVAIYCSLGARGNATNHASTIDQLCAEGGNTVINADNSRSDLFFALDILKCDTEVVNAGTHINDPGNLLRGKLFWHNNEGIIPRVNGAAHYRVYDETRGRGAIAIGSVPNMPASTTALLNPYWRDCAVTVSAGTVTAITVDGVATGITSGTVIVPTGKTIAITYSVAPTWRWMVL